MFLGEIIKLILWSNLPQMFFWLNPQIFVPHLNQVSNGSGLCMGNLGRVKAVTSNPEQMLWLSWLGLCTSVEGVSSENICSQKKKTFLQ